MPSTGKPRARWEIWVFLLIAVGMLATAGYAIGETYWG